MTHIVRTAFHTRSRRIAAGATITAADIEAPWTLERLVELGHVAPVEPEVAPPAPAAESAPWPAEEPEPVPVGEPSGDA